MSLKGANAHINVGMVYAEKGDYKETIRRFSSALESGVLPTANEQDITFQLVKLSLAEEDTQSAIKYLDRWEKGTTKISADAQALRAHIFLIEKDYEQAETFIRKALSTHKKPKESWQRILVSILLTTKRYEDALPVLEMLVAKYPDKKVYWQQITATYYVLDMEGEGFFSPTKYAYTKYANHIRRIVSPCAALSLLQISI